VPVEADGEWSLYWTSRGRPVPGRLAPVLAGWADLDEREEAADIGPGHPILIDPEHRLDPVLARFLGRSRFAWLADGTRQAYAKDYRLFFSFLWQRGRYWHEADPDDLLDWEAWRRRGQQPGRGIGGSKWQRELAALRLVYEWAEKEQHIGRSPVLVHQVRLRGGGTATVADQAPNAPFVGTNRVPDGTSPAALSRYGDATWDLSPLSRRQHEPARQVNWDLFPVALRASFKRAGWALVNLPTPDTLLERAATCRARQPGPATIASTAEHWRRYAAWLASQDITRLGDVDAACHGQWAAHVARLPVAGRTRGLALNAVSVLWGMASHLPAADSLPMPPWEAEGLRHYLPPDEGRSENGTAPVHPAVMSPLLTWALRFTEDFAADILAALAEHERLRSRIAARHNPGAAPLLAALLDEHARTGAPLPGETVKGRTSAAVSYLAGTTGASITQVGNALRRAGLAAGSTAPLGTPVTGQLCGKLWTGPISYHQAPALALRLSAACLIVVAYLSGLRPAEILHLQPGSCPAPGDDGTGPVRYRLHGLKFKAARNDDGTPAPDGEARQWTVIPPVHTAIGILEQLTAFPSRPRDRRSGRSQT
jgi:Phage integrase, N-terminal SAM-like domain